MHLKDCTNNLIKNYISKKHLNYKFKSFQIQKIEFLDIYNLTVKKQR
jgi:hypothetical protein